jgi:hypothetical protein
MAEYSTTRKRGRAVLAASATAGGAGCITRTHFTTPCFRDWLSSHRRRGHHSFRRVQQYSFCTCRDKNILHRPTPFNVLGACPRHGNRNERLDVHPFVLGRHQEPSLKQWRRPMLGCGDVLYLPSGWWHHVLSTSHSVMTNVWTG